MTFIGKLLGRGLKKYQRGGGGKAWFGVDCNFEPSCSEYAYQAIARFGVCKGLRLAFCRICRCNNPDQVGKITDEVPPLTRQAGNV